MPKKKITDSAAEDNLIIRPTSDLFTAVLWSAPKNEPILRDFINAVLGDIGWPPIVKATVLNRFNIKEFAVDKAIVLDVHVEDENKRKFNIEVQIASHFAFPSRVLRYWADLYASQLRVGDDYAELRPVISIIITEFTIFPGLKNVHNVFRLTAMADPNFVMTEDLQIHFLRLSGLLKGHWETLKDLDRRLCHWVNFFVFGSEKTEEEMASLVENDPIIREAYLELQRFSSNPEMREKERLRQRYLADYQLTLGAAKREGRAEGKAEGRAEGMIEGERYGKTQEKIEDILTLLHTRFNHVPAPISSALHSQTDLVALQSLFVLAIQCDSLEMFADALK